eukprot:8969674-Lingulodinium_polyedra.AAC.1
MLQASAQSASHTAQLCSCSDCIEHAWIHKYIAFTSRIKLTQFMRNLLTSSTFLQLRCTTDLH